MDEFQIEYLRRLHNYVSAVYSLIKHSQRVVNNYGEEDFSENYSDEIEERGLIEKGEFLRQLRHYTQKRKLPPIASKMTIDSDDEMNFDVIIEKERMMDWDGWNSDAQHFLDSLDEEIDLDEIIKNYQSEVEDFYSWFFEYMRLYFKEDLDEYEELRSELQDLLEEQHPGLMDYYRGEGEPDP